jgi:hypothetical protein
LGQHHEGQQEAHNKNQNDEGDVHGIKKKKGELRRRLQRLDLGRKVRHFFRLFQH